MQRNLFNTPPPSDTTPYRSPPRQQQQVGSVRGVVDLLERARGAGLKFPKLWLQFKDGSDLRVTVAGERSRTPGYLMLTDGRPFGDNSFYGRISPDGALEFGRDGHARKPELAELLARLAENPAEVAAQYGHLTGHCCFCGLPLTDGRSVTVGYGPVCAKRFGVKWGAA